MGTNTRGTAFYIDFDNIKKYEQYLHVWMLANYPKPTDGLLSTKSLWKFDCNILRMKPLSVAGYVLQMSEGAPRTTINKEQKWASPPPESTFRYILKRVCNR